MDGPLAYLLTWTTYGTWLHGDERGSVGRHNNTFRTPTIPANAPRVRLNQSRLRADTLVLTPAIRLVVRDALVEHCPYRNAALHSLNVRTNHVHMVVSIRTNNPRAIAGRFKARATFVLRERGLVGADADVWTARGSARYLWNDQSLAQANRYVLYGQGPRDEYAVKGTGRFEAPLPTDRAVGNRKSERPLTGAQPPASAGGSDQSTGPPLGGPVRCNE
jgi:REP element-mobilizing transposase RayT